MPVAWRPARFLCGSFSKPPSGPTPLVGACLAGTYAAPLRPARSGRAGALVFATADRPFRNFVHAKPKLDKKAGVSGWGLHDLRRTAISGMARLGVAPHVADKILNHTAGTISGVAAVYQRHEFMAEREQALDAWARHVEEQSGVLR